MKITYDNLQQQYQDCKKEIDAAIQDCLDNDNFITGLEITDFERVFANYLGVEDVATTGSGTDALICAVKAAGIGPGDEVLTTPHTFTATTLSIVLAGATPIWVDINPDTYLIDLDLLEKRINHKTKAVLFVDLYGQCPDMTRLRKICDDNDLIMIEDAAQSVGNFFNGQPVGTMSDLTCMSFHPRKNLAAIGDAGCVTGSKALMDRVRMFREFGKTGPYEFAEIGYHARIDVIQSNVVQAKLPKLQQWIDKKRSICDYYTGSLQNTAKLPVYEPGNSHSWYAYVIATDQRDKLQQHLHNKGIETRIHYPQPCHTMPAFRDWYKPCPETDKVCRQIISLPCRYDLSDEQVDYIVDSVKEFYN